MQPKITEKLLTTCTNSLGPDFVSRLLKELSHLLQTGDVPIEFSLPEDGRNTYEHTIGSKKVTCTPIKGCVFLNKKPGEWDIVALITVVLDDGNGIPSEENILYARPRYSNGGEFVHGLESHFDGIVIELHKTFNNFVRTLSITEGELKKFKNNTLDLCYDKIATFVMEALCQGPDNGEDENEDNEEDDNEAASGPKNLQSNLRSGIYWKTKGQRAAQRAAQPAVQLAVPSAVCACGVDRAACGACGLSWAQTGNQVPSGGGGQGGMKPPPVKKEESEESHKLIDLTKQIKQEDLSANLAPIIQSSTTKSTMESPDTALEKDFKSTLIYQASGVSNDDTAQQNLHHLYTMKKEYPEIVRDCVQAARRKDPNATPRDVANLLNGVSPFPSTKLGRPIIMSSNTGGLPKTTVGDDEDTDLTPNVDKITAGFGGVSFSPGVAVDVSAAAAAVAAAAVTSDEVDVQSGEEEEEIIYCQRGKLFIYGETLLDVGSGNKQWNERGIGDIRILKHSERQTIRVLMRQEKTMKVIVNHALDPRITLEPNVGSDRSWVWSAFDFATGELVETVFAIRFADSDIANAFKTIFEEQQTEMEKVLAGADAATGGEEADEVAAALAGLSTKEEGATADGDGAADAAGEVAKEE
mmetsp:Transcript_48812/g.55293  ORF Transcript_48812/g.55293 Transcript_48812/m.55293 type:complete len:640 (-) Transcript_48812:356-2275(-)